LNGDKANFRRRLTGAGGNLADLEARLLFLQVPFSEMPKLPQHIKATVAVLGAVLWEVLARLEGNSEGHFSSPAPRNRI
jgi:hypothetical protein